MDLFVTILAWISQCLAVFSLLFLFLLSCSPFGFVAFYAFVILNAISLIHSCNCINSLDLHLILWRAVLIHLFCYALSFAHRLVFDFGCLTLAHWLRCGTMRCFVAPFTLHRSAETFWRRWIIGDFDTTFIWCSMLENETCVSFIRHSVYMPFPWSIQFPQIQHTRRRIVNSLIHFADP